MFAKSAARSYLKAFSAGQSQHGHATSSVIVENDNITLLDNAQGSRAVHHPAALVVGDLHARQEQPLRNVLLITRVDADDIQYVYKNVLGAMPGIRESKFT